MTPTQQLSESRLQELEAYAEEIRWTRINELWRSIRAHLPKRVSRHNAKNFEKVVIESCKPKPGEPRTLKEIISAAVNKTLRECDGNKALAAKKLGCSRSTVFVHASCIMFLCLASSALGQSLFSLPQPVAAIAPVANPNLGSVSLAWTRSPDSNVTSYAVQFGTNRSALNSSAGVGNVTNATITGLLPVSAYYFTVTARDAAGMDSPPSNMVTNFMQPRMMMIPDRWKVQMLLPAGRTNVVQSCTNSTFTGTIRNVLTNTSGGAIWFYATNDAAQNFFRVKP